MISVPDCLLQEYPQPIDAIEEARVEDHSARLSAHRAEWSQKIQDCGQTGLLSIKSTRTSGMRLHEECAYLSPEFENISNLRFWGMSLNEITAIEEQLAHLNPRRHYLALITERHADTGLTHFSLFQVSHATGTQSLIFHLSNNQPSLSGETTCQRPSHKTRR